MISALHELLEPDNMSSRKKLKELFKKKVFVPKFNVSLKEERDIAYDRLKTICDAGVISVFDFKHNPLNIFAGNKYFV